MTRTSLDMLYERALNENVRLTNELSRARQYGVALEQENGRVNREIDERDAYIRELLEANMEKDRIIQSLGESESAKSERIAELEKELENVSEVVRVANETRFDLQSVINIMRNRQFNTNSDATRFMNGQIDVLDPTLNTVGLEELAEALQRKLAEAMREVDGKTSSPHPREKKAKAVAAKPASGLPEKVRKPRHCYAKNDIERIGIDTSNLPEDAKIIHRKDSATGEDVWEVWTLGVVPGSVQGRRYEIGRFNVPGDDPMCSKSPETFVDGCPLLPSFIRFYLVNKFELEQETWQARVLYGICPRDAVA